MKDDNKQTRRRFLKATGGVAAAAALAGCSGGSGDGSGGNGSGDNASGGGSGGNATQASGGEDTETQGSGNESEETQQSEIEADPSKTFQRVNDTISTLDPVASTDTAGGRVIQQLFDSLMNYPDGNTEVEPQLAADYSTSGDNSTYTFKLKDAKFHNGDPVTADDFVYSWERLAQSDNSKRASFILDTVGVKHDTTKKDGDEVYKPDSLAISASDEKTFKVELESPFHAALEMFAYTSFAAVPKGIVGDIKGADGQMSYKKFSNGPVGAGPFAFKNYSSGTAVEVERFDDYHDGKPSVAGVHWQIIPKSQASYQYAQGKNADVVSMPTAQYDPSKINVQRGPDKQGRKFGTYGPLSNGVKEVDYISVPTINTYYLGFNMAKVPKPVRQAFAYVANQKQLVEEVFKGRGEAAYHLTPPAVYPGGAEAYEKHAKQDYPYGYNKTQVSKAKKVMEDAGYSDNKKYSINWTQYEDETWLALGKLFRDQLSAAHVDMKIQQADFSTLLERGRSGKLEVYTLGWVSDWPAPDNFLQLLNPPQTDTSTDAPISYINWTSENGDAAKKATKAYEKVDKNQAPTDKAGKARDKAYVTMEEANWEDVGFLNLYHSLDERLSYQWADIPAYGAMDESRQMFNEVKIAKQRK